MTGSARGPRWEAWSTDAFARAQDLHRPVLLSIVTRWSAASRAMDAAAFADPAVVSRIAADWIPIRVDADLRPDIADRYTLGGWPTTAFLTEDGEVFGGGTFVEPDRLDAALRRAAAAYSARRGELLALGASQRPGRGGSRAGPALGLAGEGDVLTPLVSRVRRAVEAAATAADDAAAPAEPPSAALRLMLAWWARARDPELRALVDDSLHRLCAGPIRDAKDGGFFRAARPPAWDRPERARLLDVNAGLLLAYAEAARALDEPAFARVALGVGDYVQRVLRDPHLGAFHPSEYVEGDNASAAGPPSRRGDVDPVCYVDGNAQAAWAFLRGAALLGEPGLATTAVAALEGIVPAAYERGAGVAHCLDPRPRVRGLLRDQVAAAGALLEASDVTGRRAYADLAEELMRGCARKLWDAERGAFRDRVPTMAGAGDVGRLREAVHPVATNASAAVVLATLGARTGDAALGVRARAILRAFAIEPAMSTAEAATYGLAILETEHVLSGRSVQ